MRRLILPFLLAGQIAVASAAELAYPGPRGTYSEQAAQLYRSRVPGFDQAVPQPTITKVVEAVRSGAVARGIVPAIATTSGFPAETTRMLLGALDPGVRIAGEVTIPIDNDLMAKPGTRLADLKIVLSHPNALGEASNWLHAHLPEAQWQETRSTAAAAEMVAQGDGSTAAVAGPAAAQLYGLTLLAERIQDNRDNATTFYAIVPATTRPEQHPDHIAVSLEAPAGSKAFSLVVDGLLRAGFSVVHVNAVPLPGKLYGFRYMLVLAAERPVLLLRVTDALARDSRAGEARALLLGAWKS